DPLRPVPMLGPYATFETTCDALGGENTSRQHCPHPDSPVAEAKPVSKPWLAVRYFLEADEMTCHVAVRLASGWYFDKRGFFCFQPGNLIQTVVEFALGDVVPGGAPEVVLRVANENLEGGEDEVEEEDGSKSM